MTPDWAAIIRPPRNRGKNNTSAQQRPMRAAARTAILQRQIMDRVEAGMPPENAVAEVADWHRQAVAEPVRPAH